MAITTERPHSLATPPPRPNVSRGWRRTIIGTILFAGLAGGAWYVFRGRHPRDSHQPNGGVAHVISADSPLEVHTVTLAPGGITRTSAQIGSVEAYDHADLYAKVSGYLKSQTVDFGSQVKKGDLLAEIDDPEVVKERERAEASLALTHATVKQSQASLETARADWEAAQAAVQEAHAEIRRATSKRSYRGKVLDRYKELVARNAETQQVVDEQEENYEAAIADELSARAAEATARARATAAQAKIGQAQADLAQAEANVKVAEATLGKAQAEESYTRITAPYNGVITRRTFFPGAFIRSAEEGETRPLLSIGRIDKVRVITEVPDLSVPLTDVGDPAEVTLDALPGHVFKGQVSRFASSEDISSRTMHTEIDLDNPDGKIRPGMSGIARIFLHTDVKVATLPASVLVGETRGDKADVYVIRSGRARKTRVRIGVDDGLRVEILEGIAPDDQVILDTSALSDGMPVRPMKEESAVVQSAT